MKVKICSLVITLCLANPILANDFTLPNDLSADGVLPIGGSAPSNVCSTFNQRVTAINDYILRTTGDTARVSQNLCRYINLSDGQIEDGDQVFNTSFLTSGAILDSMKETVDVTREIELLVLSQNGRTQYVMFTTAGANLKRQDYSIWTGYTRTFGGSNLRALRTGNGWNGVGPTFHSTRISHWVFDGEYDNDLEWGDYSSCSSSVNYGSECVPGGASNSRYWILNEYTPETSNDVTQLQVTNTTEFGFSIGASGSVDSDGPSAGLDIGFSYGTSTSVARDSKIMTVSAQEFANDLGFTSTFNVSPNALANLEEPPAGRGVDYLNRSTTDELIGSSVWRDIDLSSYSRWTERVNGSNCQSSARPMTFSQILKLSRYFADENGGVLDDNRVIHDADFYNSYFTVRTQCMASNDGGYFRTVSPGIL